MCGGVRRFRGYVTTNVCIQEGNESATFAISIRAAKRSCWFYFCRSLLTCSTRSFPIYGITHHFFKQAHEGEGPWCRRQNIGALTLLVIGTLLIPICLFVWSLTYIVCTGEFNRPSICTSLLGMPVNATASGGAAPGGNSSNSSPFAPFDLFQFA